MARATTIKSGFFRVLLGSGSSPITYAAPCGFTQRSMTMNKNLEEINIPDCDDPDKVDWIGRDVTSLSISITGEGVLAAESAEDWFDAFESVNSVPVRIEIEFPSATHTWTGLMHIESIETGAANGQRATLNVSLQSDGEMTRVTT